MKNWYLLLSFLILLLSCDEEPVETVYFNLKGKNGVFITCEGNFMYGNSSLSFYDKDEKHIYNQLFYARNSAPLGDVAQSITRNGNTIFVSVNNSGKIVGINSETAEFKGVIRGLTSPRYMHFISDDKAYVSDLYARAITIVNPTTFSVIGKIDVSDGKQNYQRHATEQFVQVGNRVFVTCWSNDEYILVIDPENDMVVDSIKTPFQPKDILMDINEKIWVMCDGGFEGSVLGEYTPSLLRIDPVTLTIEQKYVFPDNIDSPSQLTINSTRDTILFLNGGIFKMDVMSRYLPNKPFLSSNGNLFYSLDVDPANDDIYVADAIDYTQSAIIYRYSKNGVLLDSFYVGITPGDYLFTD